MQEELHDLAGVYALDALSEDERRWFERHMATCAACTAEVRQHRETAAALGAAVAEPPSPALRSRVLADLDATPQVAAPLEAPVAELARSERSRPLRPRLAAVAAALLVAVLGMSSIALHLLGDAPAPAIALDEEFLAVAEAVRLDSPPGTAATFYYSEERDEGWLVVAGLEELDAQRAYQVWLFHDGSPVPAGLLELDGGSGAVRADAPVREAELVAVTVEPAGGLPEPSGPVVISAAL